MYKCEILQNIPTDFHNNLLEQSYFHWTSFSPARLSDKLNSLQVETIADQYMVISGAPDETEFHPVHICELALDFIDVAKSLTDPTTNQPIQLRIGEQNCS